MYKPVTGLNKCPGGIVHIYPGILIIKIPLDENCSKVQLPGPQTIIMM